MLKSVEIKNFGPLPQLNWGNLGPINLVIGRNDTGKTFLLKALYCVMRTLEEYRRGNDTRTEAEILAEKLRWTFQSDELGDLVTRGAGDALSCAVKFNGKTFSFKFGKDTTKKISSLKNNVPTRSSNSIFLPAKEVLSVHKIILKSREQDQEFGFDDTYLDLVRALRRSTKKGKNFSAFADSRNILKEMLGGHIHYNESSADWEFKKGNQKFTMGITAEGIKKVAILSTLLGNRYLGTDSVVFIDEPEAALHPERISQLMEIIALLAQAGMQVFLSSHSYFVVKKLFLVAQSNNMSIPVISITDGLQYISSNLKDEWPDNPIIDESIRLYKEEVDLALR